MRACEQLDSAPLAVRYPFILTPHWCSIEQEYFTPTSTKVQDFAEKNPVVFVSRDRHPNVFVNGIQLTPDRNQTFLAVFGFLSIFPLLFAL